jgi:hypothetical protein
MQSIDQQLKEADAVIIGHFLKSQSVRLESGSVATQMIFKVRQEWGMKSELFGIEEVIVHYPGGTLQEISTQVQGVPQFVKGEKIALFIKNVENRFWGLNLGFGSFKIINYGKETMLVNTLFPNDDKVGQIKLEDFESKVKKIKGSSLKVVRQEYQTTPSEERQPASVLEGKKPTIASGMNQEDNRDEQSAPSVYWLIVILALGGGITRIIRSREA